MTVSSLASALDGGDSVVLSASGQTLLWTAETLKTVGSLKSNKNIGHGMIFFQPKGNTVHPLMSRYPDVLLLE